jgi:hypothetical protein
MYLPVVEVVHVQVQLPVGLHQAGVKQGRQKPSQKEYGCKRHNSRKHLE